MYVLPGKVTLAKVTPKLPQSPAIDSQWTSRKYPGYFDNSDTYLNE